MNNTLVYKDTYLKASTFCFFDFFWIVKERAHRALYKLGDVSTILTLRRSKT